MNSEISPAAIIKKFFEGTSYQIVGKQYHSELPEDVSPWYCYTRDGGHSVLALIEGQFDESNLEPLEYMCPCPVKAALKKYRMFNGYPVVPLKYDNDIGLITAPEDEEFDEDVSIQLVSNPLSNVFEVSKPFPKPNSLPGAERCLVDLNKSFFDILCYLSTPTPREIEDWEKGNLQYGIFVQDSIPFFIVDFPDGGWNIDIPINIRKIKNEDALNQWLNEGANAIHLFLIDATTNVLKAARFISISMAEEIRGALGKQTKVYSTPIEVDQGIGIISNSFTTDQMIQRGKMIRL